MCAVELEKTRVVLDGILVCTSGCIKFQEPPFLLTGH